MHDSQGPAAHAVRLGTRGSRLALTQSTLVARALKSAGGPDITMVTVRTRGDGDRTPLRSLGGSGAFAALLRRALQQGQVDLAVHSFKDLPTAATSGLDLVCVPQREDVRDALCARDGLALKALPQGARVGTGSPRRAAQLLAARPDLEVVDIRGNVPTRLARVTGMAEAAGISADEPVAPSSADAHGDLDAVVLAVAGLRRLGLGHCATELLNPDVMLPAPAQGALAVEARTGALEEHEDLARAVANLDDTATRVAVTAERALMAGLEAGCEAPVGAWARVIDSGQAGAGQAGGQDQPAGRPASPGRTPRGTGPDGRPGADRRGGGRTLVLRALVSSPDGQRRLVRERSAPLPDAGAGSATSRARTSGSRPSPDLAVAESLGTRVASVLLEDGAEDLSDLRANRPRRG